MADANNGKTLPAWLAVVLPLLLAIVAGYGAAKYQSGAMEQRLANCERRQDEFQRQINEGRKTYVTREELKAYLDGQTKLLEGIQSDVRSLRR